MISAKNGRISHPGGEKRTHNLSARDAGLGVNVPGVHMLGDRPTGVIDRTVTPPEDRRRPSLDPQPPSVYSPLATIIFSITFALWSTTRCE